MACSEVAAFLQTAGHIIFRIFASQCHNSLVFSMKMTDALRSSG